MNEWWCNSKNCKKPFNLFFLIKIYSTSEQSKILPEKKSAGHFVAFLPPYSRLLNPIEKLCNQ